MRISSLQAFQNGVQGLQRNYSAAIHTNEQISSGNRILTPADDPVASVRLLQLEQQHAMLDQYKGNLSAANSSLMQEESTLNSVNNIMQRVRELAGEAGNGALSKNDRQAIAAELREREEEMLGLMNTRNARGDYLFAGFQGKTQPFERQPDGSYEYQGDEGQRKLHVGNSVSVATGDNGKKIFQNITNAARLGSTLHKRSETVEPELPDTSDEPDALNPTEPSVPDASTEASAPGDSESAATVVPAELEKPAEPVKLAPSSLSVSAPLVQDEVAFAADPAFPAAGIEIRFGDPRATPAGVATDYEVFAKPYSEGSKALQEGSMDNDHNRADVFTFRGVVMQFEGMPTGGERVEIGPLPNSQKQGVLDTIRALRTALESHTGSTKNTHATPTEETRAILDAVAAALTNIDHAMVNIDSTRGDIGARMNMIASTLTDNEDVRLINKSVQAELREVDYPEAISRLAFQSVVLEAAQQSFVKISQLNLFDKIR